MRKSLEKSLQRLNVDAIDFFHVWGLKKLEEWELRKKLGAVDELLKARAEGLVKHVVFSTHITRGDVAKVYDENLFEGVTLGYNAINFPFREQAVQDAGARGLGVVTMNPLAGGLIPRHAKRFDFIRSEDDPDVVSAALRFILSHLIRQACVNAVACRITVSGDMFFSQHARNALNRASACATLGFTSGR